MARSVKSSPPPDPAVRDAATRFMTSIWQLQRELGHELDPLLRERAVSRRKLNPCTCLKLF